MVVTNTKHKIGKKIEKREVAPMRIILRYCFPFSGYNHIVILNFYTQEHIL